MTTPLGELHQMDNINVPLRKWIQDESKRRVMEKKTKGPDQMISLKKQSLLRKTTIAYGIAELLRHATRIVSSNGGSAAAATDRANECSIDNFIVHVSRHGEEMGGSADQIPWNDVCGVSMISPAFSAQICEPLFLSNLADEDTHENMGKYLEVYITPELPAQSGDHGTSASNECHLFGTLLYELCSGMCPFPPESSGNTPATSQKEEHPRKKSTVRYDKKKGKSYSTSTVKPYSSLQELGYPSSISQLVINLMDGHDCYSSLDPACSDIHLMLSDPDCFLFDAEDLSEAHGGSMKLRIKNGKLYGRDEEVTMVTDAFCRVSSGKNEAVFIGGYSGSGKTMLVSSLTTRVDIAGGYVVTQKVDQISTERPLLDVLAAFNNLCLLIREKGSPEKLLEISNKITCDFESDFSVLARLLPNISELSPHLAKQNTKDAHIEQVMNLHNVCFTLQRFMRIVSSKQSPVMLFLDDLQWAGSSSLELIHALMSDQRGSSCFFFVGSYRDNEVTPEHPIFNLMSGLDSCGVTTTKVRLSGLNQSDLNLMVSESLCIFPRLCESLSDIVFKKTEGSPYFAMEFLRSLVDSRLLKYSVRERRWIWDEDKIRFENITDNVLYLLSAKMTSLPEETQLCLKIVSCFGIKADERVIGYLSSSSKYSNIFDWLDQAIKEGCVQKLAKEFKFVHDKVRESAYSLIPNSDKNQFHYDLGMLLYSVSKGEDLNGAIFQIVAQINHGIPSLIQPDMQVDVAELNFSAGSKAIDMSDYKTAYSYLNYACSLLPENHWTSHYDFSLRLFFLRAKAAYTCSDIGKAHDSLKQILERGRCVEDMLDSYYLHATILHACEERDEAYITCCKVLSQLNETIPDSVDLQQSASMMSETGNTLRKLSDDDLMKMDEMDSVMQFTLKFYTLLNCIAYWKTPQMMPYLCCRMINLSLKHGMCPDSVFGFVQYAAVICVNPRLITGVQAACQVGKAAMSLLKRYSSEIVPKVYFCYYGFVATYTEPLQLCAKNLRKGFEVGISAGESASYAFYNSILLIRTSLFGGENLASLLKEADYHIEIMTRFRNKVSMPVILAYRETISTLIDKGQSTSSQNRNAEYDEGATGATSLYALRHNETVYFNRVLQSFWLGYSQRCHHYAKKTLESKVIGRHNRLMILFYAALNAFRGVKNNNGSGSQFVKVRTVYKDAIAALRVAAELSPGNFSNKVYLLEAELNSFERKYPEAKASYAAAITSSCSSGYIHEHGLACELAGLHYKRIGEMQAAMDFLQQAKKCYTRWGSQMKVESVTQLIGKVASMSLTIHS